MKKILNNKYYLIVWAIIVLVFNTVLFLTTNNTHYELSSFWVSYAFIMAAFIAQLFVHITTRKDKESLGVEIPSTTMSVYLMVVIVVGCVFLGLSKVVKNLWLIPFITLFIINALFVIIFILGLSHKENVKNNPQKMPVVFDMAGLITLLYDLLDKEDNPVIRDRVSRVLELAEATSDLTSENPKFKEVEKQIFEYAYFLKRNVEKDEEQNIFNNINKLEELLLKRKNLAL